MNLLDPETLTEAKGERHPTDIANLLGVRLAVSSELEEGENWAEARLYLRTIEATHQGESDHPLMVEVGNNPG